MRRVHCVAGVLAFTAALSAYATGCFSASDDCELNLSCGAPGGPGGPGASASSGAGGGMPDAKCVPSMNSSPVGDDCGVFVELGGDDGKDGTKSAPVKSLVKAIELAQKGGGAVYACAQVFAEAVEIPAGVSLFGGLDCQGDWAYSEGKPTTIEGTADAVPLTIVKGAGSVRLEDVLVRAVDATVPGGSSVAAIVDGATVDLVRCEFIAGNGMAGEKGSTPMENIGVLDNPDDPTIAGSAGTNACMGDPVAGNPGGMGKLNDLCNESAGGNGGDGGIAATNGASGTDGIPAGDGAKGKAGTGDVGTGCEPGGYGQDGAPGAPGAGGVSPGAISVAGYAGAAGEPGGRGGSGQGGGGGGGGKGKVACNGASGGGGGSGGCGGFGGLGGSAGGSSIALMSLNATLTFTDVTLTAGNGGAGGDGGDGQIGGIGGTGGKGGVPVAGTTKGCAGGDGGFGGTGGPGGGGRGGHSIGIAFSGKSPTPPADVKMGTPGAGGAGMDMTFNGAAGEAVKSLEFPAMP